MRSVVSLCALALVFSPPLVRAQTEDACTPSRRVRCPTPIEIVSSANDAARQRPSPEAFSAARQIYPYAPGALYELYASPTHISVILLEPGEIITGIAAGDTARWMVTEVEAEAQQDPRTIVLVKPQSVGLATNIVIATDRRTYLVEARAVSEARYSAEIAWTYPSRDLRAASPESAPHNFEYRIRTVRGAVPRWLPARVFDDGRRTWIEFPPDVEATDMPPVFVITPEGAELANTRVDGRRLMIDRLIDRAELRLGVRAPIIVRIEREDAPLRARPRRIGGRR
ncbi:TrbG/VirB9 family P-type conjugative transfer protein [Terricaulis sp.]|uniref:TrbG/VirB9 family P-type conjugative transfer protein n=1 Tax=Terricaulis sp. TaxID=2768686 RepID=UPI002AC660D3|nr:TrbG/VirB9 family P-type conjugative transfer protein [Terricaulis sp.]MDZ4690303.1 TrbG/VirB9 family P-type conjugative transfer protein [Terricaulis sp.]